MSARQQAAGGQRFTLLPTLAITTAVTGIVGAITQLGVVPMNFLAVQAVFAWGSGGISADAYIQTSLDGGVTWFDIMNFHFLAAIATKLSTVQIYPPTAFVAGTAPTDGTLTANTVLSGILGDRIRVKYTTVGTYAGGTTLRIDAICKP